MNVTTLARLRRVAVVNMTETALVKRLTRVSDGMGGSTESWSTAGAVACRRASSPTAAEVELAGRLGVARPLVVRLPAGTDVSEADRLVIAGETVEVVHVPSVTIEAVRRVLCKEIE